MLPVNQRKGLQMDGLFNLYDIISVIGIGLAFLIIFLIPSKKKIMSGQGGKRIDGPLLPSLIAVLSIIALATIGFAAVSEFRIRSLITGVLMIGCAAFIWVEYFSIRKLLSSTVVPAVVTTTELPPAQQQVRMPPQPVQQQLQTPVVNQPAVAPAQAPSRLPPTPQTMTVECPQCHAHIQIQVGSNVITCPYCGLSGTM